MRNPKITFDMARIIKIKATGPAYITCGTETKKICMCGLSKTKPICDGSHSITELEDPNKVYAYIDGKRIEVKD